MVHFTADATTGDPGIFDTVTIGAAVNTDIAMWEDQMYVVWEDNNSGTVKFRSGTVMGTTATKEQEDHGSFSIFPNPSRHDWYISGEALEPGSRIDVFDVSGRLVHSQMIDDYVFANTYEIHHGAWGHGVYYVRVGQGHKWVAKRVMKY